MNSSSGNAGMWIGLALVLVSWTSTSHAAPNPYCPGACAISGAACGSKSDCDDDACVFADACLPGLAPLVAAVVPEGPGGLNDASSGWICGLVTCFPAVDQLSYRSEFGISTSATKEMSLVAGKRYLAVAEMQASAGTWGYFEVAGRDVAASSEAVVAADWTRVSAFFEVPATHVGSIQFRLHADGPGRVGIRRIAVLELDDYGVFVRFTLLSPSVAARFLAIQILRHATDGPGLHPVACDEVTTTACVDPALLVSDAEAGQASAWIAVSEMFGATPGRATFAWQVTSDGVAVNGARVRVELASAPDAASVVWSAERTLVGDRLGLVLPEGTPRPQDLLAVPGFVVDGIAADRALFVPASKRPQLFKVGVVVNQVDGFDAPSALSEGLDLLAELGLNVVEFFTDLPSSVERTKAQTVGLVNRFMHAEGLLGRDTLDLDPDAITAQLRAELSDPSWDREFGAEAAARFVMLGRASGRSLAGPKYRAAYVTWLEAAKISASELGLTRLDEAAPLESFDTSRVSELRPDPSDVAAATRYYYALRFWNEANAQVLALVRQALVERFGEIPMALSSGTPLTGNDYQWATGADFQALARQRAVSGFLGDATLAGQDDCLAWETEVYADYVAGVTAPWREAAEARSEAFPLATYVQASRGDVGSKLLALAARGIEWFDYDAYGPYDLSTGDGAGGLGVTSQPWLERVRSGNELLARAETWLSGARREPSPIVMLASQVDGIWSDESGVSAEEIGWHIALTQAHYPVDFMLEDEIAQGLLSSPLFTRRVLLVMRKHVSRAAWVAIERWVEMGGVLIVGGGLATHDELGQYDRERAEWTLFFADPGGTGSETITWASARGNASFAYQGAWNTMTSIVGTPIAFARNDRPVALRIPRGRGRIYALGLGLGAHYRLPETTCDSTRPAALGQRPSSFSKAMRGVMSDLVEVTGTTAPVRSETELVALHRLVGKGGVPLILAIPLANGEVPVALGIPDLARCDHVSELLEGLELPVTFGAVLTTLKGPALFTWDREACGITPEPEPNPEIVEPSPSPDEGCLGGSGASGVSLLLAIAYIQSRRQRLRGGARPPSR